MTHSGVQTQRRWVFGPASDLLLGCGLAYVLVFGVHSAVGESLQSAVPMWALIVGSLLLSRPPLRGDAAARLRAASRPPGVRALRGLGERCDPRGLRLGALRLRRRLAPDHALPELESLALQRPELRDHAHVPAPARRGGDTGSEASAARLVHALVPAGALRLPRLGLQRQLRPQSGRELSQRLRLRVCVARHPRSVAGRSARAASGRLPGNARRRARLAAAARERGDSRARAGAHRGAGDLVLAAGSGAQLGTARWRRAALDAARAVQLSVDRDGAPRSSTRGSPPTTRGSRAARATIRCSTSRRSRRER